MKISTIVALVILVLIGCHSSPQKQAPNIQNSTSKESALHSKTERITDPRDGETYAIIKIGHQTWMAENARFNSPGSIINPDNPSKSYGRLYTITALQTACPTGWHLPSDSEWDVLEIAHGMSDTLIGQGGQRGKHAIYMRTFEDWEEQNKTANSLNFNVLPAGYYASGKTGLPKGFEGLGFGAAFWSATENEVTTARFMFAERDFINKWEDHNNETEMALSCRCVKD